MQVLADFVETLKAIFAGSLPPPEPGRWLPGVGGWQYKPVRVGGTKAPGGGAWLWWFACEGVGELYVAVSAGVLQWWLGRAQGKVAARVRAKGNLPKLYATATTSREDLTAAAGALLHRQGWRDQDFEKWLLDYVRRQVGEEQAGELCLRLLTSWRPVVQSPKAYLKLAARKRPRAIQEAAQELGIKPASLYDRLRRRGLFTVQNHTLPGQLAVVKARRRYEVTPEAVARLKEEAEVREKRAKLVILVMQRRGVGRRAAERWVKRRLDAGKSLKEIALEAVGKA